MWGGPNWVTSAPGGYSEETIEEGGEVVRR